MADKIFQEQSVRFIENHDEPRSVTVFGKARAMAAATVITTIMGMKLYYDGQFSGRRVKLPVQLCREPEEKISVTINNFYDRLLSVTKHEVFKKGVWQMLEPAQTDSNNFSSLNMLSWQWKTDEHLAVVIINLSELTSQCRLKFNPHYSSDEIVLFDALNNAKYKRSVKEIKSTGLFVELKSYSSHIFLINLLQIASRVF